MYLLCAARAACRARARLRHTLLTLSSSALRPWLRLIHAHGALAALVCGEVQEEQRQRGARRGDVGVRGPQTEGAEELAA